MADRYRRQGELQCECYGFSKTASPWSGLVSADHTCICIPAAYLERRMNLPLLVVILGPTASGKTALSLHVAEQMRGEIISCDSVAVYRDLEIGTAKPSKQERRRVAHHLIDIAGPEELVTAGDYSRLARQAIADVVARGHLPLVFGGLWFLFSRALR